MATPETRHIWSECEDNYSRRIMTLVVIALAGILLLATALGTLTSIGWLDSFNISFYALFVVPVVGYMVVNWLIQLQKPRGQLIWDFGPRSGRVAMMLLTTALFFFYIGFLLENLTRDVIRLRYVMSSLSGFLLCGLFYLGLVGRLQFWSAGIWKYRELLPWDELECYEWKSAYDWKKSAFWLKHQHPRLGPVKVVLVFPDKEKEVVEELLGERVPAAADKAAAPVEAM